MILYYACILSHLDIACGHKSWHNPRSARSMVAMDITDVRYNVYVVVPPENGMPAYRDVLCIVFPGNIYFGYTITVSATQHVDARRMHFSKLCIKPERTENA